MGTLKTINIMLDEGAYMPTRAHDSDAGLDLYTPNSFSLIGNSSCTVDTGVHVEIPKGYVGFLKSKSGLNVKDNIISEGVIDSGYTGSIVVKLRKTTDPPLGPVLQTLTPMSSCKTFKKGDKITQLVILPVETPEPVLVDKFKETDRGDLGFGSTGD